jgi:hypothetical protein
MIIDYETKDLKEIFIQNKDSTSKENKKKRKIYCKYKKNKKEQGNNNDCTFRTKD